MELDIVRADPAGNITIFVLNPLDDPVLRVRAARALLAEPSLKAEQAGFVIPPERRGGLPGPGRQPGLCRQNSRSSAARHWRLEMMGGEFCGNAARSFGLYVARETGLTGKQDVLVEISGVAEPVPVHVDLDRSTAEAEIPGPVAAGALDFDGRTLPVYFFEGITHIIVEEPGLNPGRDLILRILECGRKLRAAGMPDTGPDALGLMFCEAGTLSLRPVVHVHATDSLVFESSCGSGTAALAVHLAAGLEDGEYRREIAQPGGVITTRLKKEAGEIRFIGIGGPVSLGSLQPVEVPAG
jgi:diaminopimelate epimerase